MGFANLLFYNYSASFNSLFFAKKTLLSLFKKLRNMKKSMLYTRSINRTIQILDLHDL